MGIIFFGQNKSIIDVGEVAANCPKCDSVQPAVILVSSNYYHIYWVPIFPFDKEFDLACKTCGLRRYDLVFSDGIITNAALVKKSFRHKWFTYTGVGILSLIFVSIAIAMAN